MKIPLETCTYLYSNRRKFATGYGLRSGLVCCSSCLHLLILQLTRGVWWKHHSCRNLWLARSEHRRVTSWPFCQAAVWRAAVGVALELVVVQVTVLRRFGAALHSHGDEGLGGGIARRDRGRSYLLTRCYTCWDCTEECKRKCYFYTYNQNINN